jgi:hypothetical protein
MAVNDKTIGPMELINSRCYRRNVSALRCDNGKATRVITARKMLMIKHKIDIKIWN